MSDYLPEEVITSILLRLPIKSLVICTSVCKSWGSMIKNSSFIQTHLSLRRNFNNLHGTQLLLFHGVICERFSRILPYYYPIFCRMDEEVYSLHHDNRDFDEYCKLGFQSPVTKLLSNVCFRVVGTCNGLVVLADDSSSLGCNFVIWNPSIRRSVTLPRPGLTYQTVGVHVACHGFVFDAIANDYKVVRVVQKIPLTFVEVYSLAAGSWSDSRLVDPQNCEINIGSPQAFVNGALHWDAHRLRSSSSFYFILAFDLSSELFWKIIIPKSLELNKLSLQVSVSGDGKSLALFVIRSSRMFLDIWVMKEYSVQESWTKLYTFRTQDSADFLFGALCFRKSGEVVLEICHRQYGEEARIELFSLELVSGQPKSIGISKGHYYSIHPFEESMVLLDRNDAVSC